MHPGHPLMPAAQLATQTEPKCRQQGLERTAFCPQRDRNPDRRDPKAEIARPQCSLLPADADLSQKVAARGTFFGQQFVSALAVVAHGGSRNQDVWLVPATGETRHEIACSFHPAVVDL